MARSFNGSNQYFWRAEAIITAYPVTMACWFSMTSFASARVLMGIGIAGSDHSALIYTGTDSKLRTFAQGQAAASTTVLSTGTWYHGAGVFANATARAVLTNGAGKTADSVSASFPPSANRTYLGAQVYSGGITNYVSGQIAEAGMWSAALDDSEIASLAKGFSPLLVRPASLVAYWPLLGNLDPEPDFWAANHAVTGVNSPTSAAHPRVIYPG